MSAALLVSFLLLVLLRFAEFWGKLGPAPSCASVCVSDFVVHLKVVGATVSWPVGWRSGCGEKMTPSQWLLCRLGKKYGSFLLFGGWNWTKRGLKLYGARWVLEKTLWFIISVIRYPRIVQTQMKEVRGRPYDGKNLLVITIQMRMTTNTNQKMPNKWVINHYTGDIFKPAICSSASEKEQKRSLLALPRTLNQAVLGQIFPFSLVTMTSSMLGYG